MAVVLLAEVKFSGPICVEESLTFSDDQSCATENSFWWSTSGRNCKNLPCQSCKHGHHVLMPTPVLQDVTICQEFFLWVIGLRKIVVNFVHNCRQRCVCFFVVNLSAAITSGLSLLQHSHSSTSGCEVVVSTRIPWLADILSSSSSSSLFVVYFW